MMYRTFYAGAVILGIAACSGNSNRPGGDSTAAAIADSQPGVNAPSDSVIRGASSSGMRLPTDSTNPSVRL